MGSGEGDAAKYTVVVKDTTFRNNTATYENNNNNLYLDNNTTSDFFYYNWTPHIYLYQIFCPKRGCKTTNWLQLDKVTPCVKCGSTLRAVSDRADFEVPIRNQLTLLDSMCQGILAGSPCDVSGICRSGSVS